MKLFRLLAILASLINPLGTQSFAAQHSYHSNQQNNKSKSKGWFSWLPSFCKDLNKLGKNKKTTTFVVKTIEDFGKLRSLIGTDEIKKIKGLIINLDEIVLHEIRIRKNRRFDWKNKTTYSTPPYLYRNLDDVYNNHPVLIGDDFYDFKLPYKLLPEIFVSIKRNIESLFMADVLWTVSLEEFLFIADDIVKFGNYCSSVINIKDATVRLFSIFFRDFFNKPFCSLDNFKSLVKNTKKLDLLICSFEELYNLLKIIMTTDTQLEDLRINLIYPHSSDMKEEEYQAFEGIKALLPQNSKVTTLSLNIELNMARNSDTTEKDIAEGMIELSSSIIRLFPNLNELSYVLGPIDTGECLYRSGNIMISDLLDLYKREEKALITEIWKNYPNIKKINFRLNPICAPFLGQPADFLDHVNEFFIEGAQQRIAQFNNNFSLIKWDGSDCYTVVRKRTNDTSTSSSLAL